jgi:hypothetical protein
MPPEGFEPAIPAGERLQTHTLDRSATGIGQIETQRMNKYDKPYICIYLFISYGLFTMFSVL